MHHEIAIHLMKLKHINRLTFAEYESNRQEVDQFKESIDKKHLLIENLLYMQTHLKRDIHLCKETLFLHLTRVEADLDQSLIKDECLEDLQLKKSEALALLRAEFKEREKLQKQLNVLTLQHNEANLKLEKKRKLIDDFPTLAAAALEGGLADLKKRLAFLK